MKKNSSGKYTKSNKFSVASRFKKNAENATDRGNKTKDRGGGELMNSKSCGPYNLGMMAAIR